MVSKKILGAAIAAAMLSQGAFALTSATPAQKVSAQTLLEAGKVVKTAGMTGTYYSVTAGTNIDTTMTGSLGIGLGAGQKVYVRVDLTNAVFAAARAVGSITLADSGSSLCSNSATVTADTVSQGGSAGAIAAADDHYVVFSVTPHADEDGTVAAAPCDTATGTAAAKFRTSDTFTVTLGNLLAKGTADVGVKVTTYDQLASAVAGTPVLSTIKNDNAITFVSNGVTVTPAALASTIDVAELFQKFVVGGGATSNVLASLGKITATPTAGIASAATGLNLALYTEAAATTSPVALSGDFSVGTWGYADDAACVTNLTSFAGGAYSTDKQTITTTLGTITGKYICVTETGSAAIPKITASSATVTYAKITGAATAVSAQAASSAQTLGTFTRNGTTVLVPFLNVNPDFNQKIIIVNRSGADAALTLSNLVPDVAATASSILNAGPINLVAGKQTVLNTVDLVSVTGTTKKAAVTLNIAAPSGKVDVLFQTTNAQGAQNTVILQNDGSKFGGN